MLRTNRLPAAALILTVLGGCATSRSAPSPSPENVQAEVRSALQRWNDAAGSGDVRALLSQFDDGADILLVGSDVGEVFKGRAAMEAWLVKLTARNRFGWQMDRVEVGSNGSTAWTFVEGSMTVRDGTGKVRGVTPYRFTGVLVKRGDSWAWTLFHGSVPVAH